MSFTILLQYFQRQLLENPSFFHAYQMNVEEQITNVFWCDGNMVLDCHWILHFVQTMLIDHYLYFWVSVTIDVLSFLVQSYCMMRQSSHLNGYLIHQAHSHKNPKIIFTDQDQAMARALAEVMLETHPQFMHFELVTECNHIPWEFDEGWKLFKNSCLNSKTKHVLR